jgi:hypothetical protein
MTKQDLKNLIKEIVEQEVSPQNRLQGLSQSFKAGNRILVVTQNGFELLPSKNDVAKKYGSTPHVAFRVAELTSALYS